MSTSITPPPHPDPQDACAETAGPDSTTSRSQSPLACLIFGHDYSFSANGATMTWQCSRDCGDGGSKTYSDPDRAARYVEVFNRRDTEDLGRRAPLIGLLPLRLWRRLRRSKRTTGARHAQQ